MLCGETDAAPMTRENGNVCLRGNTALVLAWSILLLPGASHSAEVSSPQQQQSLLEHTDPKGSSAGVLDKSPWRVQELFWVVLLYHRVGTEAINQPA